MIKIYVDGDACPVKDETYVVGRRYGVPVAIVAHTPIRVPDGIALELILVERGLDAADDWIAEHAGEGDVVVTGDLPLAARCLDKGARVLGTSGRVFTEDSIGDLVGTRNLKEHLRGAGMISGGPPPMTARDRSRFLSKLDEIVQKSLRE